MHALWLSSRKWDNKSSAGLLQKRKIRVFLLFPLISLWPPGRWFLILCSIDFSIEEKWSLTFLTRKKGLSLKDEIYTFLFQFLMHFERERWAVRSFKGMKRIKTFTNFPWPCYEKGRQCYLSTFSFWLCIRWGSNKSFSKFLP